MAIFRIIVAVALVAAIFILILSLMDNTQEKGYSVALMKKSLYLSVMLFSNVGLMDAFMLQNVGKQKPSCL
jgi:uncharacterized membrane protein